MTKSAWTIYKGGDQVTPDDVLERWLTTAPPWRQPGDVPPLERAITAVEPSWERRGRTYVPSPNDLEAQSVNVALLLRRPLLVTGEPGLGKSTLAYNVAWCLGLGQPLRWEISSRTTLEDGLYHYDAVEHLRAAQNASSSIGRFVTLGPLGTALLPTARPRVLLIDELDKASYDLPNDLLHVLEEAAFVVPELRRHRGEELVYPFDAQGPDDLVKVHEGRVRAHHHPVVVITSNGEREFPPAFLRRCVQLHLPAPTPEHFRAIVKAQFGEDLPGEPTLSSVLERYRNRTTDAILQAIFLQSHGVPVEAADEGLRRS